MDRNRMPRWLNVIIDRVAATADVLDRRDHYRAVAAQGPTFVRRLHNGDFSRDVLMREFLTV